MTGTRKRGRAIRSFIIEQVSTHPQRISAVTAKRFGISRQAVNNHIRRLINDGDLLLSGTRSQPTYRLIPQSESSFQFALSKNPAEDAVWRNSVLPCLQELPKNVLEFWEYGVTEMVNNAVDHSDGRQLDVYVYDFKPHFEIYIVDDGVGIFRKIQDAMNLDDERHAVLELAKGKFTTDPENHTGEGIFFSSRMFDQFRILSGDVFYSHDYKDLEDWISQSIAATKGTLVWMRLSKNCRRSVVTVFDQFAAPEDYAFSRTVVPVTLAEYGDDTLVSRSQAKRLLTRFDRFSEVLLDFRGVKSIGQAFADEIFRVFANKHPETEISYINANKRVRQMISRAQSRK